MSGLIYFATACDFSVMDRPGRMEAIQSGLAHRGFDVFTPTEAFWTVDENAGSRHVAQINHIALARSVGMVAYLDPEHFTIGVPAEIERALDQCQIPVLVVGPAEIQRSRHLAGRLHTGRIKIVTLGDFVAGLNWLTETVGSYTTPERAVIKVVGEGELPVRHHYGDAGFDLFTSEDTILTRGEFGDVPCGVNIELPDGIWAHIVGRSSARRVHNIEVIPAVIDQGYRGPLFVGCVYHGREGMDQVKIAKGTRLAQLIPQSVYGMLECARVDELSPSERGTSGFGSTGT